MFDPLILFITITLLLLIGVAYWLEIPKLSIPLIGVYIIFLFFSITENKTDPPNISDYPSDASQIINFINDSKTKSPSDIVQIEKENNKKIELKPLVFEKNDVLFKDTLKKEVTQKPIINKEITKEESILNVKQISICKNIQNRQPVQSGNTFSASVDSIFCYTLLSNTGGKQHLSHIWEYDNKVMSEISYSVKHSLNWRSWTRKTILPHQTGLWSVSVKDSSGKIIKKIQFNIVNENTE